MSNFTTTITLSIEGVEAERTAYVAGVYLRAQPAFTYPGEYAPTDPPESADYQINAVIVRVGEEDERPFDIFPLLTEAQVDAIVAKGIENGEPQEDPDDARARMIEDRAKLRGWYEEW